MIRKWYHTTAATAAGMLDVTDSLILSWSNGEVNKVDDGEENSGSAEPGTLNDPAIFGGIDDGELRMGHIALSRPVVNIRYLRGPRPFLARSLAMTRKDLEKVLYMSFYIVVDPGSTNLSYKQLVSEKEYNDMGLEGSDAVVLMGAEAVEALLLKEEVKDANKMILHYLPVIPLEMRYTKVKCNRAGGDVWIPMDIEWLYARILNRDKRLIRLETMGAPEIILRNERRTFQECIDSLIDNGLRGLPAATSYGVPIESLADLYDYITDLSLRKSVDPKIPDGCTAPSQEEIQRALKEYNDLRDKLRALYPEGSLDETGETALDDAIDEATQRFAALFDPLAEALMKEYFPSYAEAFHNGLLDAARRVPSFTVKAYEPEDGDIKKICCYGMYRQMLFFTKKSARFAAAE